MDYNRRQERDQLQLGYLILDCTASSHGKANLRLPVFALRRGCLRTESVWTTLYLIAEFSAALDRRKLAVHKSFATNGNGENAIAKRPRLVLLYEVFIRQATSSPTPATRFAKLQYLCFVFQLTPFTEVQIENIITTLSSPLADQNLQVTRWAILALAGCAFQATALSSALHVQWQGVYLQVSRLLTVDKCSRAASYLLYTLLALNILSYGDVAANIEAILGSIELHGPTQASDSSLALLSWLVEARAAENPSGAITFAERLIQWLF
jgi:hypothetical protein